MWPERSIEDVTTKETSGAISNSIVPSDMTILRCRDRNGGKGGEKGSCCSSHFATKKISSRWDNKFGPREKRLTLFRFLFNAILAKRLPCFHAGLRPRSGPDQNERRKLDSLMMFANQATQKFNQWEMSANSFLFYFSLSTLDFSIHNTICWGHWRRPARWLHRRAVFLQLWRFIR